MNRRLHLVVAFQMAMALAVASPAWARQAAPAMTGATIAGRIQTASAPAESVRRAVVTLTGLPDGDRRTATDDDGRFEFAGLPAGRYTITATKAAYVTVAYGATEIGGRGTTLALTTGGRVDVALTMIKGAAIEGIVRTLSGEPLPGVTVTLLSPRGKAIAGLFGPSVDTDDRGVYRIFGIPPGAYLLRATRPFAATYGRIERPTPRDIDDTLARMARGPAPASAPITTSTPGYRAASFAPIYYPSSPLPEDAERISVAAGEDRAGLDMVFDPVSTAVIRGRVAGGGRDMSAVQVVLQARDQALSPTASRHAAVAADGSFELAEVTPGRYVLLARSDPDETVSPPPARTTVMLTQEAAVRTADVEYSWASADLDIRGEDVSGVALALQPGAELAGRVVVEGDTSLDPARLSSVRIVLMPTGLVGARMVTTARGFTPVRGAAIQADGSFRIAGIGPGDYLVQIMLPADLTSAGWWAKAATVEARDLIDAGLQAVAGGRMGPMTVSLSDRQTLLYGQLNGAAGQPASEYSILAFSTDATTWGTLSRRTHLVRPGSDGRYRIDGLPAGEYYLVVLTTVEPDALTNPDFYKQATGSGIRMVLGDGERKVQDVQIAR